VHDLEEVGESDLKSLCFKQYQRILEVGRPYRSLTDHNIQYFVSCTTETPIMHATKHSKWIILNTSGTTAIYLCSTQII
jgi:hypothetical protein